MWYVGLGQDYHSGAQRCATDGAVRHMALVARRLVRVPCTCPIWVVLFFTSNNLTSCLRRVQEELYRLRET